MPFARWRENFERETQELRGRKECSRNRKIKLSPQLLTFPEKSLKKEKKA
jgi:hypothetical protein